MAGEPEEAGGEPEEVEEIARIGSGLVGLCDGRVHPNAIICLAWVGNGQGRVRVVAAIVESKNRWRETQHSGGVGVGSCLLMCDWTTEDSCPDLFAGPADCIPLNGGVLPICERVCSPLSDNCPVGYGCFPVGGYGFYCSPSTPDGDGVDGDECYTISSCADGYACVNGVKQATCVHDRCCTPICDTSATETQCIGDESCQLFYEGDEVPNRDLLYVGYCGIDP